MLKGRLEVAKKELENIKIKGHTGTWYEIDRRTLYGKTFYLMESEIYGDEAPGIIIDEAHEPVIEDVLTDSIMKPCQRWIGPPRTERTFAMTI